MQVYIPNSQDEEFKFNSLSGKSLFCWRLGRELRNQGVEVTADPNKTVDVALNVIRINHTKAKIQALRLNGVYHNTAQDYEKKNAGIKDSLRRADLVIYQSHYSRTLCNHFIGTPNCPHTIIFNGADPEFYKYYPKADYGNKKVILAVSKWRPHKRLKDIVGSFITANIHNTVLVVAGDISKTKLWYPLRAYYASFDNIDFVGHVPQNILAQLINRADLALHLCGYDACPNSVVELLCAGVPVISSNIGGTPELLRVCQRADLVCDIDAEYDYKPIDLYRLPKIDSELVAAKIHYALLADKKIASGPLHIQNVAAHYKNLFEDVLNDLG